LVRHGHLFPEPGRDVLERRLYESGRPQPEPDPERLPLAMDDLVHWRRWFDKMATDRRRRVSEWCDPYRTEHHVSGRCRSLDRSIHAEPVPASSELFAPGAAEPQTRRLDG